MNTQKYVPYLAVAASFVVLGCASVDSGADMDALTAKMVKTSFRDQGIAKVDRLMQDESNAACSAADASGKPLESSRAQAIEAANLKTVQWPKDGKLVGNWKEGEKIAQKQPAGNQRQRKQRPASPEEAEQQAFHGLQRRDVLDQALGVLVLELIVLQRQQQRLEHRNGEHAVGQDRQQDMREDAGLFINHLHRARRRELGQQHREHAQRV